MEHLENRLSILHKLPNYLYPIGGTQGYSDRYAYCMEAYQQAYLCRDLFWWRQLFHIVIAIGIYSIVVYIYKLLYKKIYKKVLLYTLCILVYMILYKEIYLDPRLSDQVWRKGAADICSWLGTWYILWYRERRV